MFKQFEQQIHHEMSGTLLSYVGHLKKIFGKSTVLCLKFEFVWPKESFFLSLITPRVRAGVSCKRCNQLCIRETKRRLAVCLLLLFVLMSYHHNEGFLLSIQYQWRTLITCLFSLLFVVMEAMR